MNKTSSTPTSGSTAAIARRLFAMAWEYKGLMVGLLISQVLLLALTLGGVGLLGLGVDVLVHALDPARAPAWPFGWRPPASWSPFGQAVAIAAAMLALATARWLLERHVLAAKGVVVARLQASLRTRVYDRLQRLSFRFFDAQASGSLINRVTYDVFQLRMFIDGVLLESLTLGLTLAAYFAWLLLLDWRLTLACLAPIPLVVWLTLNFSAKVKPAYKKNSELLDEAIRVLAENAQGVHVVKGFGLQEREKKKFEAASDAVAKQAGWLTRRVALFTPAAELLTQLPLVILLVYGGWIFCHEPGRLTLGVGLLGFYLNLKRFLGQVGQVAQIAGAVQQAMNGARRVFEVLDEPLLVASKPGAPAAARPRSELRFEAVSFAYAQGKPVLRDLSFAVPAGGRVAILGPTGAGKTTLLSLLPRFHDPDAGRVTLDGRDLRDLDLDGLRRQVGVVFQETFLFSTTVAGNIAFGRPEASMEEIRTAARIARADGFIQEMPQGYDTVLTEGGNGLSGGQRQRIAIARAILTDPSILVLDDPTAAIDAATEREIMEALDAAMEGRTVFIVAHRLQTLRRADRVIVLEDGRITAEGTHEELMEKSAHYREVVFVQTGGAEGG